MYYSVKIPKNPSLFNCYSSYHTHKQILAFGIGDVNAYLIH